MSIRLRRAASAAVLLAALAALPAAPALAADAKPAASQDQAAKPAADKPDAVDPKTVLLKVGDQTVTRGDVDSIIEGLPAQLRAMPLDTIWPLLSDNIVNRKLMAVAGEKAGLADDAKVKAAVARARESAIGDAYMDQVVDKDIGDAQLKAAYDKWLQENPPEEEVHARHILVDNKDDAQKIIDQLKAGGDFAQLAAQSKDSSNAESGGDLGWFTRSTMVKPFADAAFALKPGEYTQTPVETQFGFHVIKLEERRQKEAESFEDKKDELKQQLAGDVLQKKVDELKKSTKVEMFNLDGTPMAAPSEKPETVPAPTPATK